MHVKRRLDSNTCDRVAVVRLVGPRPHRSQRSHGLGFTTSAQKQAHFPSTRRRGKEGTRGREKEPTPRVPREVDH
eukprot:scaffold17084_cov130-Isochrysis_galbana.AAC.4